MDRVIDRYSFGQKLLLAGTRKKLEFQQNSISNKVPISAEPNVPEF